jgi:gamma-glutamyltranspeptidase/glutathione hydrolase
LCTCSLALVAALTPLTTASAQPKAKPLQANLSPTTWQADYDEFMAAQSVDRTRAGVASGRNGAVTVAYNGLAARAGLEALKQGGNAMDALLTAALAQNALTAGAPISYFGMLSLVYYDASNETVHTMNAEWNTVLGEDDPMSIPGSVDLADPFAGGEPSGRTALVGGFMKGVGAAHERFGRLPWQQLFEPSIHIADHGFPIPPKMGGYWAARRDDLARLAETRETMLRPDGSAYETGDVFRQPALASTLRAVATQGTDYMYGGPWGERLVRAVQADGGKMTLEDLRRYEVTWAEPLVADLAGGYRVYTSPPPNNGGLALIQAQKLALASGMLDNGHWTSSGTALRKALDITQLYALDYVPAELTAQVYPGVDLSSEGRISQQSADALWQHVAQGKRLIQWLPPKHSDDVVVIDGEGNIAAITQSINCVIWGKTAIVVDGITVGDPASFQQAQVARAGPGNRLEAPTETGILFKDGEPVLGFASMGSGLHHRTFQALMNVMHYGMTVDEAIDTPDFFMPRIEPGSFQVKAVVPKGKFPPVVLERTGFAWHEHDPASARFGGEGIWVAISRDPTTGELRAASHNRNNSAAVAY